jgi:hypothetical protein
MRERNSGFKTLMINCARVYTSITPGPQVPSLPHQKDGFMTLEFGLERANNLEVYDMMKIFNNKSSRAIQ